jgi:hypothetical protein
MNNIFSVLPPRLGGVDMLLPVFIEMKKYTDVTIELIIINNSLQRQLKRDEFLYKQVLSIADRITILPIENDKNIKKIKKFFFMINTLWAGVGVAYRMLSTHKGVLMHSDVLNGKLINILDKFIKVRSGTTVGHFKLMDLTSSKRSNFGEVFLCYKEEDSDLWDIKEKNKCIYIGYPRLYASWVKEIKKSSRFYLERYLYGYKKYKDKDLLVIFLPSTVENIFGKSELKEWIIEVEASLKKVFIDSFVVFKPHPMQDMKHLKSVLNEVSCARFALSFLHPGLLASQAKVVVSHHSSTIIDALALGVPVIQHQFFTNHWLDRWPKGSEFIKLGHMWTQNKDDLEKGLTKIRNNNYVYSNFNNRIGHKNNSKLFFKKINLKFYKGENFE